MREEDMFRGTEKRNIFSLVNLDFLVNKHDNNSM